MFLKAMKGLEVGHQKKYTFIFQNIQFIFRKVKKRKEKDSNIFFTIKCTFTESESKLVV